MLLRLTRRRAFGGVLLLLGTLFLGIGTWQPDSPFLVWGVACGITASLGLGVLVIQRINAGTVGKHLFGILRGHEKISNHPATGSSSTKMFSGEMEAVIALDGIEKKYSAECDFSRVGNRRLASLLSGTLGSKAVKYRGSGVLRSVHFSKQVLVSVARITRSGMCSMPFVVQRYVHGNESRELARFLLVAEFFDDAGGVLQPATDGQVVILGHAQVLELEAPCGMYSYCNIVAPTGSSQALLSLLTVETGDEIVVLSDFAISALLPAVPITMWGRWNERDDFSAVELQQDCRAIFPVRANTEFAIQVSASSTDQDGRLAECGEKAIVAAVEFFTDRMKRIPGRYEGTASSKAVSNYVYISSADSPADFCSKCLRVPPDASWMRLKLLPWEEDKPIRLNAPILYGTLDSETAHIALELDKQSIDLLSAMERLAARHGRVSFRKGLLQSIYRNTGAETVGNKLKAVSGVLRELDETWVPDLPVEMAAPAPRASAGIRICHLHKVAYPYENSGGAIRNLNIVQWQKAADMNPYVVLPLFYPFGEEDDQGFCIRVHDDVPYFEFRWSKRSGSLPLDRLLEYNTLLTYSVVRAVGADLIHAASGFRGYELALQGMALREKLGIPLVYEVRSFHEHTWGPSSEESLTAEYTRLRMQKEDYCMRAADHVVTISEAMRGLLVERGVSKDRIDVVPNGVDANAFFQSTASGEVARERHDLNGHIVIGYISNMSRREGHDVLIQAVGKLGESGIEAMCLLVGDGPERSRLEQLATSLGMGERIVFTGEIDHKEIHEYYRAMDLFVVPRRPDFASDYVTPLKPYEAMALGVPIVVSDRPALKEIVGDSERGMLFHAESVDSLVSVLKESIANRDHRLKLADAAKSWIMRERTWKANCSKYAELYAKVISEFAPAPLANHARETTAQ